MENAIPEPQAPRPSQSPNPSGARRWSARHWRALEIADAFDGLPEGEDRYSVIRLLDRVGGEIGWNRTLVSHLSLLIGYTRPQDWTRGQRPIVWLSRRETAHVLGLSTTQVGRNQAHLLDRKAIAFRDSANYRRFGYRDGDGRIVEAWGIDLSPAAALLPKLTVLSETLSRHREEWRRLKRRVSATRRRIRAALCTALTNGSLADAAGDVIQDELHALAANERDAVTIEALHALLSDLERLEGRLRSVVEGTEYPAPAPADAPESVHEPIDETVGESDGESAKTVATATEYGCQGNRKGLPPYDYNTNILPKEAPVAGGSRKDGVVEAAAPPEPDPAPAAGGPSLRAPSDTEPAPRPPRPRISYDTLLAAVPPSIAALLPAGRRPSWPELTDAAAVAAGSLGISPHAWGAACRALGRQTATIAVIVIAAKRAAGEIDSPGGYLRAMTARGQKGELRLGASVHGLLHGKEV